MIKLKIKYGNSQTDLRFPCTENEMNAALERIHAEDVTPLELYVSEVIFPEELVCIQDRFVNLDEVNFLGKRMDSFFGDEEYQFYEAMKLEGFDTLPDLINLSFNLNRYPLIRDIGDMGKIGREYLLTVNGCVPADDADDPKYAELGRELIQSGNGIFTEHGLLFVDENTPFQRLYLFVSDTRRQWDKLGLYDGSQCDSERSGQLDYTDRILVLNPSVLKDECKTPQNQLFYATHGNGCRPDSLGTKVFGFHVSDGEKTYYRRTDFVGALKEELIPEWAKENTQKYLEADDLADEPDEDGGMTMNM